jgi:Transmembrane domain of unknown function (DUF3566)
MTQSPFGGTAPPSVESGNTRGGRDNGDPRSGRDGTRDSTQDTAFAGGSNDFGATTISGSPRDPATNAPTATNTDNRPLMPSMAESRAGRIPTPQQMARPARARGPRRARLQLRHISPLTVLKFSCVLAIALFFVWLIMVGVLYGVLDATNVISNVNDTVVQLNGSGSKPPITAGVVFGGAAIVGVVNIVLFVALTTIGSVIYNLCADLVGGIEITLSER